MGRAANLERQSSSAPFGDVGGEQDFQPSSDHGPLAQGHLRRKPLVRPVTAGGDFACQIFFDLKIEGIGRITAEQHKASYNY
jgi:hypothetical protein